MKFDDILRHIGEFGRYQKQQYFLLSMVVFSCGVQVMMTVFTLATPKSRCAVPGVSNDTFSPVDSHHSALIDWYIPPDDECHLYADANDVITNGTVVYNWNMNDTRPSNNTRTCDRWVYDESDFTSTVTTQMNFVCDREILKSHAMMTMMSGQMLGCLVLGPIADVVGRKKAMMSSLVVHLAASLTTYFSVNIYMLGALYFINGAAMASAYTSSYTLGMELTGPSWRHVTGIAVTGFWSLGMLWVCFLAFLIRDWKHLQLAASCPIVLFVLYFFLVPESARWLIRQGRYSEAQAIITRAATTNKVEIPEEMAVKEMGKENGKAPSESIFTLFKYPRVLVRALIMFFNWFVCSLTYYGLGLNVGQLSGNIFVNFCFSAVFEIAAYAIIIFALSRFGRKSLYCSSILLGAIACLLTVLPVLFADSSAMWSVRLLAMVGKFGVSGAFGIAWMFTSELFPTSMRASITGSCSFFARIGGVVATYIANLTTGGQLGHIMPQIVFGSMGIVAGLFALLLPETNNRKLPESVREAVKISREVDHEAAEAGERKPMTVIS